MTQPKPPPESSRGAPRTLPLVMIVGVALFVLGWALGRCSSSPSGTGAAPSRFTAATPPTVPPKAADAGRVELRLDAGGLRLLPDASLHLRPIEPLDGENSD